jgi:hypothetical protein
VQCKHYRRSTWSGLGAAAEAEAERLKRLKPRPGSYRFVTSLGLTPARKRELRKLLAPYVQADGDVFGLDDLEALLDRHADVERRHIKLWLASGPQLEALLRPGITNRARTLATAIKHALPLYVQAASFFDAWELLRERRTCLIAGPPGIGKTTLAHMLVAEAIGRDFEPIEVSADIDEAWTALDQSRRQVFLYDDFLGHTVLGSLAKNEDSRLLRFIHSAAESPNTLFVMTTREYILQEAARLYEAFRRHGLPDDRLLLRLESYTPLDRARILYNHVWHSDALTREALEALARDGGYRQIIEHPACNPRTIEYITGMQRGHRIELDDWLGFAVWQLDHPEEIWRNAYDELGDAARTLLTALATFPNAVHVDDLEPSFRALAQELGVTGAFSEALRVLDDSFVRTDSVDGENVQVQALDPGLQDFIERRVVSDPSALRTAIRSAQFFEQLTHIWTLSSNHGIDMSTDTAFTASVARVLDSPTFVWLSEKRWDGRVRLRRWRFSVQSRLVTLIDIARSASPPHGLVEYVESELAETVARWRAGSIDEHAALRLMISLKVPEPPLAPEDWALAMKDVLLADPYYLDYWERSIPFARRFRNCSARASGASSASALRRSPRRTSKTGSTTRARTTSTGSRSAPMHSTSRSTTSESKPPASVSARNWKRTKSPRSWNSIANS